MQTPTALITITELGSFSSYTKEGIKAVLFYANWNACSKKMVEVFESSQLSFKERAGFCLVNIDDNQEIPISLSISTFPTILVYKNGEIVDTLVGFIEQNVLEDKIRALF